MTTHLGALSVLLVEDQPQSRQLIAYMLSSIGVRKVVESPGGADAIDRLAATREPFDLVLCDWMMPNVDGLAVLRELKQRFPSTDFLMLTARADQASVAEAIQAGVNGYLRKPFTLQELGEKLRAFARRH